MKQHPVTTHLNIGTRLSPLARWQTDHVVGQLSAAWPGLTCTIRPFTTQGDLTQSQNKPLPAIGGKGLFTSELEAALRDGEIDLAVHSLKDLPVEDAPGLTLGAITSRADVRDVLVARNGWTLATLPHGAVVGSSSTRRTAQLLSIRPDLLFRPIRGNVETRQRKVVAGEYDATILAAAGLTRLGLIDPISEWLSLAVMLPAPGQGALAIQCRADDIAVLELLAAINDAATRLAVTAERDFLHRLGGGCSAPVAAYAQPVDGSPVSLHLSALVGSPDGRRIIRVAGIGAADMIAEQLAAEALTQGAGELLGSKPSAPPAKPVDRQPLAGKRIVLTRPREQAHELVESFNRLGATPLVMPMIRIVPLTDLRALDEAIGRLATYDWLVFTSVNAVAIFGEQWRAAGQADEQLRQIKIAAVGPATAAAIRQLGAEPTFVPDTYLADAIGEGLGDVGGQRILLPQAAAARVELAQKLASLGACIEAIPVYTSEPADLCAADLAELARGVDAIVFTSGLTVRNFVAAVQQEPTVQAAAQRALVVCIGPVTAAAAREAGLPPALVADEATTAGLVRALCSHFAAGEENHDQHV